MDVRSGAGWPASALSNFAAHPFVLDDVWCASMEGLLQALKFDKPHVQIEVCRMAGLAAKNRGRGRNRSWQRVQTLWWRGVPMRRTGPEYQRLLTRAFDALHAQSQGFRAALEATGDAVLTHSLGRGREAETVLTAREFCAQLTRLRDRGRAGAGA